MEGCLQISSYLSHYHLFPSRQWVNHSVWEGLHDGELMCDKFPQLYSYVLNEDSLVVDMFRMDAPNSEFAFPPIKFMMTMRNRGRYS